MGNQTAKGQTLSDNDIRLLSQQSGLPPHIIQQLYEAFMERAGKDGRMTISDFKEAYTELNPNANMFNLNNDAERVFMMFDKDHNGVLTFDEFMMVYILLQKDGDTPANRWQNALNVVPTGVVSRPGQLNSGESLVLLQRMNQVYQIPDFDPAMQNNQLWNQLGPRVDANGYIPQADYLSALSAQPNIGPHLW